MGAAYAFLGYCWVYCVDSALVSALAARSSERDAQVTHAIMIPRKFTTMKKVRCIHQYFLKWLLILSFFESGAGQGGMVVLTSSFESCSQKLMLKSSSTRLKRIEI